MTPKPVPGADEITQFYWDAARRHELQIQRCGDCASYIHPPEVACPRCGSDAVGGAPVSGRGVIYSFGVVHRMFHPGFAEELPYVVALVELDEQPGLRVLSNIVGAAAEDLHIGMTVRVVFEDREGHTVPQFSPARDEAPA